MMMRMRRTRRTRKKALLRKSVTKLDIEKYFNDYDIVILDKSNYPRANNFFDLDEQEIDKVLTDVNEDAKKLNGKIAGKSLIKNKNQSDKDYIEDLKSQKGTLMKYNNVLNDYLISTKYVKTGEGIFYFNNPHQLFDRLESLGGSILAGNNRVIPEFSQIAHLLDQMKVILKKTA